MTKRTIAALALSMLLAGCAGQKQDVHVTVTENGFEPAVVTVRKGEAVTLVITRKAEATCATEAVFAETGQKYPLPLNEDVRIPIATDGEKTLHYACAMDMYKGQVVVK